VDVVELVDVVVVSGTNDAVINAADGVADTGALNGPHPADVHAATRNRYDRPSVKPDTTAHRFGRTPSENVTHDPPPSEYCT
jgi:hypothetical protein